jgi:hypothetical protein
MMKNQHGLRSALRTFRQGAFEAQAYFGEKFTLEQVLTVLGEIVLASTPDEPEPLPKALATKPARALPAPGVVDDKALLEALVKELRRTGGRRNFGELAEVLQHLAPREPNLSKRIRLLVEKNKATFTRSSGSGCGLRKQVAGDAIQYPSFEGVDRMRATLDFADKHPFFTAKELGASQNPPVSGSRFTGVLIELVKRGVLLTAKDPGGLIYRPTSAAKLAEARAPYAKAEGEG